MTTDSFHAKQYSDPRRSSVFGKPSGDLVVLAAKLAPVAKVLDLGCGDGRNALFLSRRGHDVTGLDTSEHAICKLQQCAYKEGLNLTAKVCDMRRYKWTGSFDLVIASASLHLVKRRSWQKLLAYIREHTKPGGYVLISVFTDVIPPHEEIKDVVVGAFHNGELFRQFPNWDTLVKESYVKREKHPGVRWHRHSIDKLLAQKPL